MAKIICFHHNDPDGHASGAIVRYALGPEVQLIPSDYDAAPIPWEALAQAEKVIVVDFSFPVADMIRLAQGRELVWIDHHKSAIAQFEGIADDWPGIRDLSEAACVLTWRYFFPERLTPRAIVLIGDRDIWRWAEADTGAFNESLYHLDHQAGNEAFWKPLLDDDPATVDRMIKEGAWLREISLGGIKRLIAARGFEVRYESHRTLVVNTSGNGDLGQRGRDLGYEIVYCYADQMQNGVLTTNVTLFSSAVDVSEIARRYGGGGHAGAAGFTFPRAASPFPPGADVQW